MDAAQGADVAAQSRAPGRTGRPYDHSRDAQILQLTLEALADQDYERVTLDAIAARSGRAKTTLYRRWPTKEDLVIAAVLAAGRPPEADRLPNEGSLRADLLAVTDSSWLGGPERRAAIFAGLTSAARTSERLAAAIRTTVTQPYVEVYQAILLRAVEREEVPPGMRAKVPLLARIIPAMSDHRLATAQQPIGRAYFIGLVDDIVLPALGQISTT